VLSSALTHYLAICFETDEAVRAALQKLHNILAELAGLYRALGLVELGTSLVVHDYKGMANWMPGRWKRKAPTVAALVEASERLIANRRLAVAYRPPCNPRAGSLVPVT